MDNASGVGVLDKAVGLLRSIAQHGPQSLIELQESTGLPRATAHRLAVALEEHGLARRDRDGRFALGFDLIALGNAASDSFPLGLLARPHLERLRDGTGESVQLYVREGDHRRCVVSLQSPHGLRWIVAEGSVLTMERGSAAAILGGRSRDEWVESVEEREPGVASVSASVRDNRGRLVAAVSVSGPVERLTRQPGTRFGEQVARCAAAIGAELWASSRIRG